MLKFQHYIGGPMSYPRNMRRAAPHALTTSLALVCGIGAATPRTDYLPGADHAALAREVLAATHAAPPLLCGLAARAVDGRFGGWGGFAPPDAVGDASGAVRWALTERPDEAAVSVLLAGLAESDDCTR